MVYYYYCIYPKYSDTSTPYHTCSKIWTSTIYYLLLCLKIAGCVANSDDPDESFLDLHCLLKLVCPNKGKYGISIIINLFLGWGGVGMGDVVFSKVRIAISQSK